MVLTLENTLNRSQKKSGSSTTITVIEVPALRDLYRIFHTLIPL